jgi:hypothetical protein
VGRQLPFDYSANGVRVVNPGAVSLSADIDKSASYALLDADDAQYRLAIRRFPYDRFAVVDQLNRVGRPARGFLIKHLLDAAELAEVPRART